MSEFSIVIPARYASTRLPGKMLRDVAGKPLIARVIDRAQASRASEIVVATDDARIAEVARSAGVVAMMTSPDHNNGSERIDEVVTALRWPDDTVVVNLQGDEALVPVSHIQQVVDACHESGAEVATLAVAIVDVDELFDPNAVKVVLDDKGGALYFSRAPVPWDRQAFADGRPPTLPDTTTFLRHIGMYALRVGALKRLVRLPRCPIEEAESLEQLRFLHAGARIQVAVVNDAAPPGVDTEADLKRVIQLLEKAP